MSRAAGKAIHRNDAEVFAEARFMLDNQAGIPGTVRIHVDDGTVTLTGTVARRAQRTAAEQVVRHVGGVRRVVNRLNVWNTTGVDGFEDPDR